MRGWHNESMRHSLAARGIPTKMDLKLADDSATKWLRTSSIEQALTPELEKILLSAENPQELNNLMKEHETEMARNRNRYIGHDWGDYLVCDEAVEIMSYILKLKGIDHEILMGFGDTGDTHVWIRVGKINYDPTEQGMHEGQIISKWDATKRKSEDLKYIDVDDEKVYWDAVVVMDGEEENRKLRSSGRSQESRRSWIIVDLDGTIYDVSGRLKAAKKDGKYGSVKFWNSFMDPGKVKLDKPIPGVKGILDSLSKDVSIIYLSGRRDNLHKSTIKALRRDNFPEGEMLILRPKNVRTEEWKDGMIRDLSKRFNVVAGIGDTPEDVSNYRKFDIPAVKVVKDKRWSKTNVSKLKELVK